MVPDPVYPLIAVGIDQGIANCGYGVVLLDSSGELRRLDSGLIKTTSKTSLPKRMVLIEKRISDLVDFYGPVVLGCEKLFFNAKQKGGRNKSVAIVYTNMATGVLYVIAGKRDIVIAEFTPGTIKKHVAGNGRAEKEEVEQAVHHLLSNEKPITSHESDAIAIAITAVKAYASGVFSDEEVEAKKAKKKADRKKKGVKKDAKEKTVEA